MKSNILGVVLSGLIGLTLATGCSSTAAAPAASCSNSGAGSCSGGAAVQACVTKNGDGSCSGIYYTVGSNKFTCNSCTDTTKCATDAVNACVGTGGGDSGAPHADGG